MEDLEHMCSEGPWSIDGAFLVLEKWWPNLSTTVPHAPQLAPSQQDFEHATLNSAILSLSLNRGFVPPTPANSPRSTTDFPHSPNPIHNPQTMPPRNTSPMPNPPTSIPSNQVGPFMTNGELREATKSSSATESDSETVVMFNLDKLNEDRPVWLRGAAWERGQILESTEGLIDPLVSRVDRDRLRVEIGGSSNGPNIPIRTSEVAELEQSLSSPTSARFEPGFLSCLHCDQGRGNLCGPSRKRIGFELGRLVRNICQRLICGFFPKEVSSKGQEVWKKCGFSEGWEVPRVGFSGGLILAWLPRQDL
nr:hypothetical protein CFP56_76532 [Quercus suber]